VRIQQVRLIDLAGLMASGVPAVFGTRRS
jgi:hypothetical protein